MHVFDGLEQVYHQIEERTLEKTMLEIDYHTIKTLEYVLPAPVSRGKNLYVGMIMFGKGYFSPI